MTVKYSGCSWSFKELNKILRNWNRKTQAKRLKSHHRLVLSKEACWWKKIRGMWITKVWVEIAEYVSFKRYNLSGPWQDRGPICSNKRRHLAWTVFSTSSISKTCRFLPLKLLQVSTTSSMAKDSAMAADKLTVFHSWTHSLPFRNILGAWHNWWEARKNIRRACHFSSTSFGIINV